MLCKVGLRDCMVQMKGSKQSHLWIISSTTQELAAATRLIERLILAGAHDFTRAALRTSFLASCVSACRSRTMSLADTVTVMAQR
jgi:hypothetical protein